MLSHRITLFDKFQQASSNNVTGYIYLFRWSILHFFPRFKQMWRFWQVKETRQTSFMSRWESVTNICIAENSSGYQDTKLPIHKRLMWTMSYKFGWNRMVFCGHCVPLQANSELQRLRQDLVKSSKSSRASVAAQSILQRVELERDEALADLRRMVTERDSLRERLKVSS